jgi:hypothetical protein
MEKGANEKVPSWTVRDSPLLYVNHKDYDFVCCKGSIHQVHNFIWHDFALIFLRFYLKR